MTLYILTKISIETIINVDPDQTVLLGESDQSLHCLSKRSKVLSDDWPVKQVVEPDYMKTTHKSYAEQRRF